MTALFADAGPRTPGEGTMTTVTTAPRRPGRSRMTTSTSSSFLDWLTQYRTERNSIGDFARDALADRDWPADDSYQTLRTYLEHAGAIPQALDAFDLAWTLWAIDPSIERDAEIEIPDALLVRVAADLLYDRTDPRASHALPTDPHPRAVVLGLLRLRLRDLADSLEAPEGTTPEQLQNQRAAYAWAAAISLGAYLALPEHQRDALPTGLRNAFDQQVPAFLDQLGLPRTALVAGALLTMPEDVRAALDDWEHATAPVWEERQLGTSDWPGWADVLGATWEQAWPRPGTDEGTEAERSDSQPPRPAR
jgi:uncharacterized protein YozE (UPF0346 family)